MTRFNEISILERLIDFAGQISRLEIDKLPTVQNFIFAGFLAFLCFHISTRMIQFFGLKPLPFKYFVRSVQNSSGAVFYQQFASFSNDFFQILPVTGKFYEL